MFDIITESECARKRLDVNDGKNPSEAAGRDTEYYEIISHGFIF